MPNSDIIIINACVITGSGRVFPDGFISIREGLVDAVGPASKMKAIDGELVIDACGRYVIPGLINPHMHFYGALARGISVGRMNSFGDVLKGLWWKLDRALNLDDVYLSALVGGVEAIRSGVTTVIDHHASYGEISGSISAISEAMDELGLRASLCFEISDRHGAIARDDAVEESALWLDWCMTNSANHMQRGMVGLHASMTLSDESLAQAFELMELYSVGAHVHCAEGVEDCVATKRVSRVTPIERLVNAGVLDERSFAVHCVHATKRDIALLKKSKATVIHNPMSNMNNAVGRAPILEMAAKGIPIAIGTDGMSAGVTDDIRVASVLHKHGAKDAQACWDEIHDAVWGTAPKIASEQFGVKLGCIERNAAADIIIIDAMPTTPVTVANSWGHMLFGILNNRVRTTIIDGRVRMIDHNLVGIDEDIVSAEAMRAAKSLWKRM